MLRFDKAIYLSFVFNSVLSVRLSNSDCMLLSCHVRVQSESLLYSCLNVKELIVPPWPRGTNHPPTYKKCHSL